MIIPHSLSGARKSDKEDIIMEYVISVTKKEREHLSDIGEYLDKITKSGNRIMNNVRFTNMSYKRNLNDIYIGDPKGKYELHITNDLLDEIFSGKFQNIPYSTIEDRVRNFVFNSMGFFEASAFTLSVMTKFNRRENRDLVSDFRRKYRV